MFVFCAPQIWRTKMPNFCLAFTRCAKTVWTLYSKFKFSRNDRKMGQKNHRKIKPKTQVCLLCFFVYFALIVRIKFVITTAFPLTCLQIMHFCLHVALGAWRLGLLVALARRYLVLLLTCAKAWQRDVPFSFGSVRDVEILVGYNVLKV